MRVLGRLDTQPADFWVGASWRRIASSGVLPLGDGDDGAARSAGKADCDAGRDPRSSALGPSAQGGRVTFDFRFLWRRSLARSLAVSNMSDRKQHE